MGDYSWFPAVSQGDTEVQDLDFGVWPNNPMGYTVAFTPAQLSTLLQWFDPTYSPTTLQSLPVFVPKETGTLAAPRGQRCVALDGTDDYAVSTVTNIIAANMSFGGWVHLANWNGSPNHLIVGKGTNNQWQIFLEAGSVYLRPGGGTAVTWNHTGLSAGWHHVFGTVSGTTCTIYVDGVVVATGTSSQAIQPDNAALTSVGRFSSGIYYLLGKLYDIRVYGVAKTAGEVAAIYNQHLTPTTLDRVGLLAGWALQEEKGGAETLHYDWSGNERHLTKKSVTEATYNATDTGVKWNLNNEIGYTLANNLLTNSEDFTTVWAPLNGTTGSATGNTTANPLNGLVTADTLTAGSGGLDIRRTLTGYTSGATYTASIYVKAGTCNFYRMDFYDTGPGRAVFNLTNGTVGLTDAHVTAAITNVGNGWYRCSVTRTVNATTVFFLNYGTDTNSLTAHTAAGNTLFAWGAQLELGGLTPYKANGATSNFGSIIPASLTNPTQDAAGNALGNVGPIALPAGTETNAFTGDGTAAYVNCSIPLIPATANVSISFWLYAVAGGAYDRVLSQTNGGAGGFELLMDSSSANLALFLNNDAATLSSVATTNANQWNYVTLTRVSDVWTLTVTRLDGSVSTTSRTLSYSVTQAINLFVLKYAPGSNFSSSRIAGLSITTGGVTKYPLFDQCGGGVINTNRNFWIMGSDGSATLVTGGIVGGTIANIYANRCPYVRDWCIQYGGSYNPNLLSYTEDFSNAYWSKNSATVTGNSAVAPNGTTTADTIAASTTGGSREVGSTVHSCTAGQTYTVSFHCKPDTVSWCYVGFSDYATTDYRVTFNIGSGAVGAVGSSVGSGFTIISSAIEPAANGSYRCILTFRTDTARSYKMVCGVADGSGDVTVAAGASIFAWGAQLEGGSIATPYQANATTPSGAFIPGRISSNLDAAGNTKTLAAGKHGNPYSRVVPNPWNAPALVNIGYTSATKLAPSDATQSIITTDTKFRRAKTDGSDRYFATRAALTGTDKTNAEGYVA